MNSIEEIWISVPDAPKHSVSNFGNVKNFKEEIYIPNTNGAYYIIETKEKGKRQNIYVHRTIAMAFVPNPQNKPRVNHKDGNKLNNHFLNLEWTTAKENSQHAVKTGLIKSGIFRGNNPLYKPIIDTRTGRIYNNVAEAAAANKLVPQTLYSWLKMPKRNKSTLKYWESS